ncbi:MAG: hypothetical protein GDA41_08295 [Rhodospirillales bacterium]|nr:hypothetical protein [Rhodospirillales bacterium]
MSRPIERIAPFFEKRQEIGFLPAALRWPAPRPRRTALRDRASRSLLDPERQPDEAVLTESLRGSAEVIKAKAEAAA